jgi:glycerol kinase
MRPALPPGGLILALDQGSHASRAVLYDASGSELAQAHAAVATRREGEDRVEQDAESLVLSLLDAVRDACDAVAARGRPMVAAGLATQRSTIVCWERSSGRALTAAISWQDRRNAEWLERFEPEAARVRAITGLPLSPHYGASKLCWCLDHVPAVQRAAAEGDLALGPLSSFLASRLLHGHPCLADPANASRTLLYDPAELDWSPALLRLFGLQRSQLPDCVPSRHAFGTLDVGAHSVPLTACTGDQSAAAFAFGRPAPTCALVNIGTGAFIQRVAPQGAALPPGMLSSVLHADTSGILRSHEGTVNGAGSALEWLRARVALDVERALATLSAIEPRQVAAPVFMNGVGGLGAPYWQPRFPVEFVGDGDDRERLVAVLESIAFLLCVNLEALQRAAPLRQILVSGGLARSDYLCRCLAALSGLPVERRSLAEATARGVAFLAAGEPASWRPVPVERVFDPVRDAVLDARYADWRREMALRGAVA